MREAYNPGEVHSSAGEVTAVAVTADAAPAIEARNCH